MIELNKIYHLDCIKGLRKLDANSVDLVIADPPYNVNLKYKNHNDCMTNKDYIAWCRNWFTELKRVCSGVILITPGYNNLANWMKIEEPKHIIIWNKPNANSFNKVQGINVWEPILYYLCSKKIRHRIRIDLIRQPISRQKGIGCHPCPKPLFLFEELIRDYSNPGDLVFDPFMGSGTTAVACKHLYRNFIGFEICKEYIQIAEKRLCEVSS